MRTTRWPSLSTARPFTHARGLYPHHADASMVRLHGRRIVRTGLCSSAGSRRWPVFALFHRLLYAGKSRRPRRKPPSEMPKSCAGTAPGTWCGAPAPRPCDSRPRGLEVRRGRGHARRGRGAARGTRRHERAIALQRGEGGRGWRRVATHFRALGRIYDQASTRSNGR